MYYKNMQLIIFDLDGTLVDSIGDITISLNYALKPAGFKRYSEDEVSALVGGGITMVIGKILGEEKSAFKEEVLSRFLDYYWDHIAVSSIVFPGVIETLEDLSAYRKVVLTNKREAFSRKVMDQLGLTPFFELIFGSDSVAKKKPAPEAVRQVLSRLSVKPSEAIMIGDSEIDIEAGKSAGIKTVGVTYGYRDRAAISDADFIIDDIRELPGLLEIIDNGAP